MTSVITYKFGSTTVQNPDGSYQMQLPPGATVQSPGPGTVFGENLTQYVSLRNAAAAGRVSTKTLSIDQQRFSCRVIFRIPTAFSGQQVLVSSTRPQFIVQLLGSATPAGAPVTKVDARINNAATGWSSFEHLEDAQVPLNEWVVVDVVHDFDTLCVFLNNTISLGCLAFARPAVAPHEVDSTLAIGGPARPPPAHAPVSTLPFTGDMALFRLSDQMSVDWEEQVDRHRETVQWYLTRKRDALRATLNLGDPLTPAAFNPRTGCWTQACPGGLLMYHTSAGAAFVMYGRIWDRYKGLSKPDQEALGYLITDEQATTRAGGRKSLFSAAGIYFSPASAGEAVVVNGQIYTEYERTGESAMWGWPVNDAYSYSLPRSQPGRSQNFGTNGSDAGLIASWWHKDGTPTAFVLTSAMHKPYGNFPGGPGTWGWPVSNVTAWLGSRQGVVTMKAESSTFFWSQATGGHEVHGDIAKKYLDMGGPDSVLGLPISNEERIEPSSNRVSYFEHGAICWFGSFESLRVVTQFDMIIGTLDTKEDEGPGQGQNDLFIRMYMNHGADRVFEKQYPDPPADDPDDNSTWDGNVVPVNWSIPVTMTADRRTWTVVIEVWEEDDGLGFRDRMMGRWTLFLSATNAWGFHPSGGALRSGPLQPMVNNITATINPHSVNPADLSPYDKFWAFRDTPSYNLAYAQFAQSFIGVDSDGEWTQESDRKDKLWYDETYIQAARQSNSFGMCLEAANVAVSQDTVFRLPLSRFSWDQTVSWEVGVKTGRRMTTGIHDYKYKYHSRYYYISEMDAMVEFQHAQGHWTRQDQPLIQMHEKDVSDNYSLWLYPINFHEQGDFPTIDVLDARFPGQTRQIVFKRADSEFRYDGAAWTSFKKGSYFNVIPRSVCFRDTYWGSGRSSKQEGQIISIVGMAASAATRPSSFNPGTTTTIPGAAVDITNAGREAARLYRAGKTPDGIWIRDMLPVPNRTIYHARGKYTPSAGIQLPPDLPPWLGRSWHHPRLLQLLHPPLRGIIPDTENGTAPFASPDFTQTLLTRPENPDSRFTYELHCGPSKRLAVSCLIDATNEQIGVRGEGLARADPRVTLFFAGPKTVDVDWLNLYGHGAEAVQVSLRIQVLRGGGGESITLASTPGLSTLTITHAPHDARVVGDVGLKVLHRTPRLEGGAGAGLVRTRSYGFGMARNLENGYAGVRLKLSPCLAPDTRKVGLAWLAKGTGKIARSEVKTALPLWTGPVPGGPGAEWDWILRGGGLAG